MKGRLCKKCGANVSRKAMWCGKCGADLRPLLLKVPLWVCIGAACIGGSWAVLIPLWLDAQRLPFNPYDYTNGTIYAVVPSDVTVEPGVAKGSLKRHLYAGGLYKGRRGEAECILQNDRVLDCAPRIVDYEASEDGRVWAMVEQNPQGMRVIQNGKAGPTIRDIRYFTVTAEGTTFYVGYTSEGWRAYINGNAGPVFEDITFATCSQYGKRCAYVGEEGGKVTVVDDGRRFKGYDRACCLSVNGLGTTTAWAAESNGQAQLLINGRSVALRGMPVSIAVGEVSGRVGWLERAGSGYVVVENGEVSSPIKLASGDNVSLRFIDGDTELAFLREFRDNQGRLRQRIYTGAKVSSLRLSYSRSLAWAVARDLSTDIRKWADHGKLPSIVRTEFPTWPEESNVEILYVSDGALRMFAIPLTLKRAASADVAVLDPELKRVRDRLADAVRRKAVGEVITLLAPDVRASFGSIQDDIEEFRKVWRMDDKDTDFWQKAEQALHGGWYRSASDQPGPVSSYASPAAWVLPEKIDPRILALLAGTPGEAGWVNGEQVPLKDAPSDLGKTIAVLNSEPVVILQRRLAEDVETTNSALEENYDCIVTINGIRGWVRRPSINTMYSPRFLFGKYNGQWRVSGFVQGD